MSRAKTDFPRALEDRAVSVVLQPELDPGLVQEWDRCVIDHPGADITQHVGWGRLRSSVGFEPSFLLAFRGARLVGGAQLLRRQVRLAGGIGYLPYGPLIFAGDGRAEVRDALCTALRDLSWLGLSALFIQPPDGAHDITSELYDLGFRPSEAGIAPRASTRIDLTQPEQELKAGLGRKLRRWTNRWEQRGVRVRQGGEGDLPLLAELLEQTAQRHGFKPLSLSYLRRLYRELAPAGRAKLFVGEIDGDPVAASLMTACGGVLKTRVSGFERSRSTLELRAPAAVRWSAIRWAKANGFDYFDFGGISERSTDALLSGERVDPATLPGPDQFKISFGGSAYRYPTPVELINSPALRHAYHLSKRVPGSDRVQSVLRAAFRGGLAAR